jgi:hypothetical protein
LWYLAGLKRSKEVKLTQVLLSQFGVDRFSKYRALTALRDAGLISYSQINGKNPVVTILDIKGVTDAHC